MENESDAIRRRMVEAAVERHELLSAAYEANSVLESSSSTAGTLVETVRSSLDNMQEHAASLTRCGAIWRQERQHCQNALSHHAKLLQLLDAPELLQEAVENDLFSDALTILQHVLQTTSGLTYSSVSAFSPTGKSSAAATSREGRLLLELRERTQKALHVALEESALPKLAGPLSVDSAFRLVQFLRLAVPPSTQSLIPEIFLVSRTKHIRQLLEEAAGAPTPMKRLRGYLQVYKLSLNEVIREYNGCFMSANSIGGDTDEECCTDPLLSQWCRSQLEELQTAIAGDVAQLSSSYELGVVWEQGYAASLSAAKAQNNLWPVISALVVDRAMTLFEGGIAKSREAYQRHMSCFAWTSRGGAGSSSASNSKNTPTGTSSFFGGTHTGNSTRNPSFALSSFTGSFTGSMSLTGTGGADLLPPIELMDFPPLAYALNGFLQAANSIHRLVLPGMRTFCAELVADLVRFIALDLGRDGDTLALEETALTYSAMMRAFGGFFYPHVLQCMGRLFGEEVMVTLQRGLSPEMTMMERLLGSMEALQGDTGSLHSSPTLEHGRAVAEDGKTKGVLASPA